MSIHSDSQKRSRSSGLSNGAVAIAAKPLDSNYSDTAQGEKAINYSDAMA